MRKLGLDVDALEVESFETVDGGGPGQGTVYGNQRSVAPTFCHTQCGGGCPSGPSPCEGSIAFTDGLAVCPCDDTTGRCVD